MDVASFCRQSRVLVVAGKGGVGKTTVAAALARTASAAGLSVLIIELEGKPGLPAAFGRPYELEYEEEVLVDAGDGEGGVRARRITPDDALLEYLADHGMRRISRRLVSSGALDVVSTAIPGIRDILVLGRVKQLERDGVADLLVVDAPATGHAMTFLSSAQGLLDAARSGPVRSQAAEVVAMLADPERCQVVLVTLPEEMPVNELIEAAYQLEDRIGVQLGPVVVNGCLPDEPLLATDPDAAARQVGIELDVGQRDALRRAAGFRAHRRALQQQETTRLAGELPLPQLPVPFLFSPSIGLGELDELARALTEGIAGLPGGETPDAPGPDPAGSNPGTSNPSGSNPRTSAPGASAPGASAPA